MAKQKKKKRHALNPIIILSFIVVALLLMVTIIALKEASPSSILKAQLSPYYSPPPSWSRDLSQTWTPAPSQKIPTPTYEPTGKCSCSGRDKNGSSLTKCGSRWTINCPGWSWQENPVTREQCASRNGEACTPPYYYYWSGSPFGTSRKPADNCTYYDCHI